MTFRPWMAGALGLAALLALLAAYAAFNVACGETADCLGLYAEPVEKPE